MILLALITIVLNMYRLKHEPTRTSESSNIFICLKCFTFLKFKECLQVYVGDFNYEFSEKNVCNSLCRKLPYLEIFRSVFPHIRTEYLDLVCKSLYSAWIWEKNKQLGAYLIPLLLDKALVLEEHLFQETLLKKFWKAVFDFWFWKAIQLQLFMVFLDVLHVIAFLLLFAPNLCNKGFIFR